MTELIKAVATYEADITKKLLNSPGFDLNEWARNELIKQDEAFVPDKLEYMSCEIVK